MKTKHTPGPWTFSKTDDYIIEALKAGAPYSICKYDVDSDNEAEDLANARLIAAAPSLFDQADRILEEYGNTGAVSRASMLELQRLMAALDSKFDTNAIAKATGGQDE